MKHYFYSESSFYDRHMLVKVAIVCVESGSLKKKARGKYWQMLYLTASQPFLIWFPRPGSAKESLAQETLLSAVMHLTKDLRMQHLGYLNARAVDQLLFQLLFTTVRNELFNCWGRLLLDGGKCGDVTVVLPSLTAAHQGHGGRMKRESAAASCEACRGVYMLWLCPHLLGQHPSLGHMHREEKTYPPGTLLIPRRWEHILPLWSGRKRVFLIEVKELAASVLLQNHANNTYRLLKLTVRKSIYNDFAIVLLLMCHISFSSTGFERSLWGRRR